MTKTIHIYDKFEYFEEDCLCVDCLHFHGAKRGCALTACCCDDIRADRRQNHGNNRSAAVTLSTFAPTISTFLNIPQNSQAAVTARVFSMMPNQSHQCRCQHLIRISICSICRTVH